MSKIRIKHKEVWYEIIQELLDYFTGEMLTEREQGLKNRLISDKK